MKSIRKYLVNAFEDFAMGMGWDDSSKHPRGIRHCGYKSCRQWARDMAEMYEEPRSLGGWNEAIIEMIEDAARNDQPLTQTDFDAFVDEEVRCW